MQNNAINWRSAASSKLIIGIIELGKDMKFHNMDNEDCIKMIRFIKHYVLK